MVRRSGCHWLTTGSDRGHKGSIQKQKGLYLYLHLQLRLILSKMRDSVLTSEATIIFLCFANEVKKHNNIEEPKNHSPYKYLWERSTSFFSRIELISNMKDTFIGKYKSLQKQIHWRLSLSEGILIPKFMFNRLMSSSNEWLLVRVIRLG